MKIRLGLICLLSSCLMLSSCGTDSDVRVIKMAHSLDTNHPVHKAMVYMAERLTVISGGKMQLDIYPGGQLGSERESIELLQIGSLAMTKVSASPLEGFVPAMKVFGIPYVFRDHDHYWRVLNGEIGKELLLAGEKVRLRGLGYFDAGSRSYYTVDKPIRSPDDLQGMKIRVQNSQTAVRMVKAMGGSGTPISWGELYTALQQGVVDGAENNPPSFFSSKHYEVCKFFTLNEHTSVPDIVIISSYVWNSLSAQEQSWLQQAMDEAVVFQRKLWVQATNEALEAVKAAGVEIIYPDKQPFMDVVQEMQKSYEGTPAYDLLERIKAI
ncbi:TRAP transporter substrate-binding protein [Teredinibacter turnerae]|uniref:TRAP transporter solute receptor, DctP family n=1 Tax=Teredinibacter turnerae (strain ATCC 39867 / T7901) TaxID=377629 RepID=C5BQ45_TERTT|nr:TRAP transporter substrate-binding protein [Teredinibacter turnerae]ACR12915.1 TRAP transporter solute receptor, DctP family [Teredinibacter turnerae T7901]